MMAKNKGLKAAVLISLLAILSIACCAIIGLIVENIEWLSKCDFEGGLTDEKIGNELFAALRDFERQHNLNFDHGWTSWPTCTTGGYSVELVYQTPPRLSNYGTIYALRMSATYSPKSKLVTLQIDDQFTETEDVLNCIDTLEAVITEFENTPQVEEFSKQFIREGIDLRGIVYEDSLRIETAPRRDFSKAGPSTSADISYSIPTRSIPFYSLPNRMTWQEFPEAVAVREIVSEHLLVGELSNCSVSMKKQAYANTDVYFLPEAPSVRAGVRITCVDTAEDRYLGIILHPDGSYQSEGAR